MLKIRDKYGATMVIGKFDIYLCFGESGFWIVNKHTDLSWPVEQAEFYRLLAIIDEEE